MEVVQKPIGQLHSDPNNARKHDPKNIQAIKGSLAKFKQQKPIVITKDNIVLAGNGTLQAARELEWQHIDCVVTDLESFNATAFALADNRTAELAEWDEGVLAETLKSLDDFDFDIGEIGFDGSFLPDPEPGQGNIEDDAIPETEQNEFSVVEGDVWHLGEHRLMCGDSTKKENVELLMNGEKADMVFTDPPYNLQERGQTKRTNKTESKRQDFGDWDVGFKPLDVLPSLIGFTKKNSHIFVCTSSYLFGSIHDYFEGEGLKPNYITWCKNNPMPSLSKNRFVQATEIIIHSIKGSPIFNYPCGFNLKNWVSGNVESHTTGHPSQKPIYIIEYCLSPTEGSVLDLFLGSGSTLIACEKTNRKCYGMELDPHYCSVIIKRWQDFTGQTASKVA